MSPEFLLELAKTEFIRSKTTPYHPFKYIALATVNAKDGSPEVRTVVTRAISEELGVIFYTDSRSPKVQQMMKEEKVSLLFYHPKKQLQIRMKGRARIIAEEEQAFQDGLDQVQDTGKIKDYSTVASPSSNLLAGIGDQPYGQKVNFAAIEVTPEELDVLLLENGGHYRAKFTKEIDGWEANPLVP
ncbi:pyridoxamine 5'-phosphate oxidase family protein [Persicobacter sp. CCB-QB2]|uniref:pyridoxamine 5'-phosphate oxidase family protein n=1 Tax=Persicobacter sp. CCB-QB2 TaxID=1561025 RepID=UPI0006A992CB|nr:pyridoxamine 5'-phosphate oxidase family protein [Persicobacter sp. CCB-QB2]